MKGILIYYSIIFLIFLVKSEVVRHYKYYSNIIATINSIVNFLLSMIDEIKEVLLSNVLSFSLIRIS